MITDRLVKGVNFTKAFVVPIVPAGLRVPIRAFLRYLSLTVNFDRREPNLIFFFVPGTDAVTGGIMSIISLYEETVRLFGIHKHKAFVVAMPNTGGAVTFTRFENNVIVFSVNALLSYFVHIERLIIHLPEGYIKAFVEDGKLQAKLRRSGFLHINILNQNAELLPSREYIAGLKGVADLVTSTSAHKKYSNSDVLRSLQIPSHHLSVFVSPEQYAFKKYFEKENLLVYSPDYHPLKKEIVRHIEASMPQLRTQEITGLTYQEYKELIARAKWSLTFGEGLDGYFVESVFSGAISLAVYNDIFFTEDFRSIKTIYNSYEELKGRIVHDIIYYDDERNYTQESLNQFRICSFHYNYDQYVRNLAGFYRGEYSLPDG